MVTQVFRILLISIFALLSHALFNIGPGFGLSKQVQYPLIIAMTPYIIAKLPLLGTKDLMTTGTQPLVSLVFLVLCTVGVQFIVKEIKQNSQLDSLSKYMKKDKPLSINGFKIERDFMFVLCVVLLAELVFQGVASRNKYDKIEKAVLRALQKFHKKS